MIASSASLISSMAPNGQTLPKSSSSSSSSSSLSSSSKQSFKYPTSANLVKNGFQPVPQGNESPADPTSLYYSHFLKQQQMQLHSQHSSTPPSPPVKLSSLSPSKQRHQQLISASSASLGSSSYVYQMQAQPQLSRSNSNLNTLGSGPHSNLAHNNFPTFQESSG